MATPIFNVGGDLRVDPGRTHRCAPTVGGASRPQRIALLYDHTLAVGGVENYLLNLLKQADPQQYQFTVFSTTASPFDAQAAALGVRLVPWADWSPLHWAVPFRLARRLRQEKIDLVHCHAPIAAFWGRIAARWDGIPALVTVHLPMDAYHGSGRWLRARLGRWLYTSLDTALNFWLPAPLIFVSEQVHREQIARKHIPAARGQVIPMGIDLAPYQNLPSRAELRARLGITTNDPVIICVGRLSQHKGQDLLLQAAAQLLAKGQKFQIWLVGEGEESAALQALAAQLGLGEVVQFWGARADIPHLLGAADIFALPARYEAAPLSILEAMAAGLPVVASRCGEIPAWVGADVGSLVNPEDVSGLVAILSAWLQNPDLRSQLGASARRKSAQFDASKMTREIFDLYRVYTGAEDSSALPTPKSTESPQPPLKKGR